MLFTKNKLKKRLRTIIGIALASLFIIFTLGISAFAESTSMASDIIPDGTNIPDTDIGGATGMESTLIPQMTTPSSSNGTVPQTSASSTSMMDNMNTGSNLGRILGVIIAVIVVLAIIVLIIVLVPKRDRYSNDQRKK